MPRTTQRHFVLILKSQPQQVAKVEPYLRRINRLARLNKEQFNKLLVVTTEAVNNGILHGNRQDPEKHVTLTCDVETEKLVIHIRDEGPGFDVETLPDPRAQENLFREHGRGVFLMRSLMDNVSFKRDDEGSDVVMTLKIR
ncbi:MAG: ATP-binding protein [Ignavibacteriales bacterium]|nr:ATP-binding protein [Ignavibacteriales bacterium]